MLNNNNADAQDNYSITGFSWHNQFIKNFMSYLITNPATYLCNSAVSAIDEVAYRYERCCKLIRAYYAFSAELVTARIDEPEHMESLGDVSISVQMWHCQFRLLHLRLLRNARSIWNLKTLH